LQNVASFSKGEWVDANSDAVLIESAVTGKKVAQAGNPMLDFQGMLDFAKATGGVNLRRLTFHDRARMLKALAVYLGQHKDALFQLAYQTGATKSDNFIDIDGGIGTMLVYASKGRREMPDQHIYLDGSVEQLSKNSTFQGQHICTSLQGVAVHINAFNFPVWGMLEKLAPTLLAGVPAIVKPATSSCYVTELCVRLIDQSGILPKGAIQMIAGGTGDLLDQLGGQDVISFTGSAKTAHSLRAGKNLLRNDVRFVAEQDSLNASILGPDAVPGTIEFDLFIKEVCREITTKAGQKCTAIRRMIIPENIVPTAIEALSRALDKVSIGDPMLETTQMGALINKAQKNDVVAKIETLKQEAEQVYGDLENFRLQGADRDAGAFLPPVILRCSDSDSATALHQTEAFGPVSTVIGYRDVDHAIELANKSQGSLVASVFTRSSDVARQVALHAAAFHGRLYFNNRESMNESTGHGSPLPHMVHGGPGRAGGGEELGGIRGVMHYMQRTAVQGSPDLLASICQEWIPGAATKITVKHPFTKRFGDLEIGDAVLTPQRTVSLSDIEHFAEFTGDNFYADMDQVAAAANPFFPGRVAHGYLLLAFAAGLFVDPKPGPVLANTGLDKLQFLQPVLPGDRVRAKLVVKQKAKRNDDYGQVRWHVSLMNQDKALVARYELLTMVSY